MRVLQTLPLATWVRRREVEYYPAPCLSLRPGEHGLAALGGVARGKAGLEKNQLEGWNHPGLQLLILHQGAVSSQQHGGFVCLHPPYQLSD